MRDFVERLLVHCPDHEASARLAAFFARNCAGNAGARVVLRLPGEASGGAARARDRRTFATLRELKNREQTFSVTTAPAGGAAGPQFTGTLGIEQGTSDDSSYLVLKGRCTLSPDGGAGLFDIRLADRVARAITHDLLHTIRGSIEYDSAREKAARAGQYRAGQTPIPV